MSDRNGLGDRGISVSWLLSWGMCELVTLGMCELVGGLLIVVVSVGLGLFYSAGVPVTMFY